MARRLLYVLLALTLALNGISAPWAMTRMTHGDHRAPTAHTGDRGQACARPSASAPMAHHGHHNHTASDAAMPAPPDGPTDAGRCCDGVSCQCGCMLPPVVPFAGMPALAVVIDRPALIAPVMHFVPHHDTPPLRPPAA